MFLVHKTRRSSSTSSDNVPLMSTNTTLSSLPAKSEAKYLKAYELFIEWKNERGVESFSEEVFLTYFEEMSETKSPPTLWACYSMLKKTLRLKYDIRLETYSKLLFFLKKVNNGYQTKTTKVFTSEDVDTFLNEAPDNPFLSTKVAFIFAVHGGCRSYELVNLRVEDIERHSDQLLLVKLIDKKTEKDRSFIIRGEYKKIVDKYWALRPHDVDTNRFFLQYRNGKCIKQVIGKNRFNVMPQEIASFLKLPNPNLYTGYCFRRTSATLTHDYGVDLTVVNSRKGSNTAHW